MILIFYVQPCIQAEVVTYEFADLMTKHGQ